LLLQDHLTMSPCGVKQQEKILKTGNFSVPVEIRRSTKQPGLAAAESSKPELRPSERAIADRCAACRRYDNLQLNDIIITRQTKIVALHSSTS